ncbi:heme peroxidase [Karstenula rhodostoma CBS 690.94]|uniref:Heme peroxidase n=1 Tax=Karstenula rhodostoma CBS 690.94 TaxID=1392251 RepID=A0A9P4UFK8_9PLEO|nr:heme peroxidase [Karstenula rhodostoma CBS 690.94]
MSLNTYQSHVDTRPDTTPPKPDELSELDKLAKKIGGPFKKFASVVGASLAAVPTGTGDGSKLQPEPTDESEALERIEGNLRDLSHLGITDYKTLLEIGLTKATGQPQDDKDYVMEALIRTASDLPDGSKLREKLTGGFLTQLWNDLEHPPLSYLGAQYQYRSADGSFNSLVHPQLGAAGTPYARTVKPSKMQTPCRPDAGVVFDSVMTRKHAERHPNEISSVLFYLASIIIHDCFRTDHRDYSNSLTSSYLDLSPLYGSNQDEQNLMRTFADGKLKPDAFSEQRLLFFPPGVACLLIMFNRFHNHVVTNLALINEGNRFPKPVAPEDAKDEKKAEAYQAQLKKYDNDIFQTGRLITCGLYVNIILIDYVRTILNLNRTDSNWQLNPRADIKDLPIGVGNQVSAEFNLVYRWHSTLSTRDEAWTQELWDGMFGKGRDPKTVGNREFLMKLNEEYQKSEKDPGKRTFAGLKRNEDGSLPDQAIVDILVSSVEDCANSFGPNRVPAVMRAIEVLGIEQSRAWNLGSLNEFRKYFGLEPHTSFEDITSDKYVAEQLKHLYDHPDNVEIYPGIVVEDAKKAMAPGSGLTPSYTVSRAVLSDAVALVRGDRFYTRDYNPRTLTNWGYAQADSDTAVDNGCVFYKLFLTAFPAHFSNNSVYAHYPLTVPSAMKVALEDPSVNKAHLYDFSKPVYTPKPTLISSYAAASTVLKDQETFKVTWGKALIHLMGSPAQDFMLAGDGPKNAISRSLMSKALYVPGWEAEIRSYYATKTAALLKTRSAKIADFHQVDIIRDVGNLAHVHFASELFQLPLKTTDDPHGIFTEAEMYLLMSGVFALVFFDADPVASFPLHLKSKRAVSVLGDFVEANVAFVARSGKLSDLARKVWPRETKLHSYGLHFIQRLLASGMEPKQLVWGQILGTAGGMVSNQGALFAQIVEFFLLGEGTQHWAAVQALAANDDDASFEKLSKYVLEAGRIAGETAVLREAVKDTTLTDAGGETVHLKKGDRLFVNLHAASLDAHAFPNPRTLDLSRPAESYIHLGAGPHACLGAPLAKVALTAMLREIARLKGLRPAAGTQGRVHSVEREVGGTVFHGYLTEMWDGFWPFPCALKVNWDE